MSILKCKMCGGSLNLSSEATIGVCEYCGSKQTLPKTSDDIIINLFNRANNLRIKGEFERAADSYEKIIEMDDSEAEAHWGLVLCRYGIEYVEDPITKKRIPTCHRTLYDPVSQDVDYQAALDYSDTRQQVIYENEAEEIDRIQKAILAIVQNESPFDIFICYKETDEEGNRTNDSVIANDIYHHLSDERYKVFFAAITLEDKLGQEYEPYIFAALNSAKIMIVIGTKPEFFKAVWVKNEWSRYLSIMKKDRSRMLIPCYKDMDPYKLPEEFAHLQALDMSKIGFLQDLIRGIKKIIGNAEETDNLSQNNTKVKVDELKKGFIMLEAGLFDESADFFNKIIDNNPQNGMAYLGKLMSDMEIKKIDNLSDGMRPLEGNRNYNNILKYVDEETALTVKVHNDVIVKKRKLIDYDVAVKTMNNAQTDMQFRSAASMFRKLGNYKDSNELLNKCEQMEKAYIYNEPIYNKAKSLINNDDLYLLTAALAEFVKIRGWRDTDNMITYCKTRIDEIRAQKKRGIMAAIITSMIIAIVILIMTIIILNK